MTSRARTARPIQAVALALGTLTVCAVVVRLFWVLAIGSVDALVAAGPDSAADLLIVGMCAVGAVVVAWLGLGAALAALSALPGAAGRTASAVAVWIAPAVVRRATAVVLGTAIAAGAAPALAHAGTSSGPGSAVGSTQMSSSTGGLTSRPPQTSPSSSPSMSPSPTWASTTSAATTPPPAPDPGFAITGANPVADAPGPPSPSATPPVRPVTVPDPGFAATSVPPTASSTAGSAPPVRRNAPALGPLGSASRPAAVAGDRHTVTVVRGDSLWHIAQRHLGPGATARQIAREWPRWYAANRAVIGPDPDLIHAGQVLVAPTVLADHSPSTP